MTKMKISIGTIVKTEVRACRTFKPGKTSSKRIIRNTKRMKMIHKLTLAALDQENSQQNKKGIMNLRSNHWLVIKSSRSTGQKQTETRKNLQN